MSNATTIAPEMYKLDPIILAPKVKNNREAHEYYLMHTMEQASILREVIQIVLWYLDSGCSKHMIGDRSQLTNFIHKFLGTVKFGNDQVAKLMGKHTCFVRNLEGVDLHSGSRGTNLYSLSIGDMMASSPICLLLKATKTMSWLWHRRLSHLNFGALNHLARNNLVRGLHRLKFEKDHLCSACAMGKSKKQSYKPKSDDTNQEKLYLLHMDLYGPMRLASVNGKSTSLSLWMITLGSHGLEPALHVMTHATSSSRLVPNPPPSVAFVPPSRKEWDLVFQPVFDEFYSPPASIASLVPVVEVPALVESTSSPSSTLVDQDAPSPSTSQTTQKLQSQVIPLRAEDDLHDLEVSHMSNDPYFGILIPETISVESSSSDVIHAHVHSNIPNSEHSTNK
nr:hypothetical protein [Tanacetum cinerariifolium]